MSNDDDFSFADEFASFGDELTGKAFPKGNYEMQVKKVVPKLTSGQKRSFVVTLTFTKGPLRGKEVTDQMTWSPESDVAARIFAQGLNIMGASQDWIKTTKPSPAQIAERMTGALVEVVLTDDEWQGQKRNRVRYNKSLGRATKPADTPSEDDLGSVDMGTAAGAGGSAEDLSGILLDDHPGGLEEFAPKQKQKKVSAGSVQTTDDDDNGLDWP